MPMPSIHDLTLPLLRLAAENEVSYTACRDRLADLFGLTPDEREEMLTSGAQTRFVNRVRWATVKLGMAELVEKTRPKHFRATQRGRQVLAQDPPRLDYRYLSGNGRPVCKPLPQSRPCCRTSRRWRRRPPPR